MRIGHITSIILCAAVLLLAGPTVALLAQAYAPEHTFQVAPQTLSLNALIGAAAQATFNVAPDTGDFTYPTSYQIAGPYGSDHCSTWEYNEYGDPMQCTSYDYAAWAGDGLLCEYLSFEPTDGSYMYRVQSGGAQEVQVSLRVPCLEGQCPAGQMAVPFPSSLLGHALTCDVTIKERAQVSLRTLLTPYTAFADTGHDVLHITATIGTAASATPTLTLPSEARYGGVRGVASTGPDPEKGVADKDTFTFKVVYTNADNRAPDTVGVKVDGTVAPMLPDTNASDPLLHDGVYTNGEQYLSSGTFPKGRHTYQYTTTVAGTTVTMPDLLSFTTGYPSVAFIPGIQASRLAVADGTTEYRVWEPVVGDREKTLLLDEQSNPTVPGVYTNGVLDRAYGFDIYGNYITFMNSLVTDHTIAGWKSFPYDWRFDVRDVARNPIALPGGSSYRMSTELEALAQASDSGTVAIVAHSNGGLVAKALIGELTQSGKDALVSDLILVAVPQLGTPKTIPVLLHGEDQAIPLDWWPALFSRQDGRAIARTLPGVYSLLPSRAYFDKVVDPVVSFDAGAATLNERAKFGDTIDSYNEMVRFLGGEAHPRPAYDDVRQPEVLVPELLTKNEATQNFLAAWQPPAHVHVSEIVGWGMDTVKGIKYVTRTSQTCAEDANKGRTCFPSYKLDYEPVFTVEGDGTVVWGSASANMGASIAFVDLDLLNRFIPIDAFQHAHHNLLGVDVVQDAIRAKIQSREFIFSDNLIAEKPLVTAVADRLRFRILSPVSLTIIDQLGRRVGISTSTGMVEESIPGSYYLEFGEGKYVGVPVDGQYTVVLSGTGTGTFTFIVERVVGDVATTVAKYEDVPVDTALKATLRLTDATPSTLALDTNGDGRTDVTLASGSAVSFLDYLTLFDGAVKDATISKPSKILLQAQSTAIRLLYKKTKGKQVYPLCTLLQSLTKVMVQKKLVTLDDGSQLLTLVAHLKELSHN